MPAAIRCSGKSALEFYHPRHAVAAPPYPLVVRRRRVKPVVAVSALCDCGGRFDDHLWPVLA